VKISVSRGWEKIFFLPLDKPPGSGFNVSMILVRSTSESNNRRPVNLYQDQPGGVFLRPELRLADGRV